MSRVDHRRRSPTQGQALLAGDIRFELNNREATPPESAFLDGLGHVAGRAGLRSMARLPDGSDQALVELKAVDAAYPLYGKLESRAGTAARRPARRARWRLSARRRPLLLERLGLTVGDRILLGNADLRIARQDRTRAGRPVGRFRFRAAPAGVADALRASGLVQTGSLVEHAYKVTAPTAQPTTRSPRSASEPRRNFPQAGWAIRTRDNAAPALTANIDRFSQFLTLVGLTALIVGGVGVANAVRAYLDAKRGVIATFKCLGALGRLRVHDLSRPDPDDRRRSASSIGLVLGALMPFVAAQLLAAVHPGADRRRRSIPARSALPPCSAC